MFLTPWLIGTVVFFAYPLIVSVRLSFSEITQLKGFVMEWIGLDNYSYILFYDTSFVPTFIEVVRDTLINTPLTLVFSLIIAMLINRPIPGRGFFRTAFFLPVLLGTGYVMEMVLSMNDSGVGAGIMLPMMIQNMLGTTISSVVQTFLDRITVVLWKSGVQIILFLAGLQGISPSLYEAAKCDGATEWESFWKITLPMISPIILLNFVYTMVNFFTSSDNALVEMMIDEIFTNIKFARGAAMAWIYCAFVLLMCGIVFGVAGLISRSNAKEAP